MADKDDSQEKKPDFQERRQFPRIKRAIVVQYKVKDFPQAGVDVSQTKDLSEEGVSFTISHPLALKAVLNIKLNLPVREESIELEGEVTSCKEIRKNIVYSLGIKFINLTEKQRELLKSFIQSFLEG